MRNQPATGCFLDGWTRLHLIWPSLMQTIVCTGGLGAPSSVALTSLSGVSRQRTYPVAGYGCLAAAFVKVLKGDYPLRPSIAQIVSKTKHPGKNFL